MATLDELELRLRALEQAQAAEPTSYYTSMFSGEEMDQRLAAAGVLGAASTPQEALAALGAAVQENELDNAYFVGGGTGWGVFPVNQRGQTQYTESGPMVDRWNLYGSSGGSVSLDENGLTVVGGNPYTVITQTLKRPLPVGATYSMSIFQHDGSFYTGVVTIPDTGGYSTIAISSKGSQFRLFGPNSFELVATNGDTLNDIEIIKLEPGGTQTAAYQKSDGTRAMLPQNLNYQIELEKCQAYQIELNPNRLQNPTIGVVTRGPGSWYVAIPMPTSMRTTPAVSASGGTLAVECVDGAYPVSQITPLSSTAGMLLCGLTFSAGTPSSAQSGTLYVAGSGSGTDAPSILLNANL